MNRTLANGLFKMHDLAEMFDGTCRAFAAPTLADDEGSAGSNGQTSMEDAGDDGAEASQDAGQPTDDAALQDAAPEEDVRATLADEDETEQPAAEAETEESSAAPLVLEGFDESAQAAQQDPIPPALRPFIENLTRSQQTLTQSQVDTNNLIKELFGEARQKQTQAQIEATKPKAPPDDAEPWQKALHLAELGKWESQRDNQQLRSDVKRLVELTQSQITDGKKAVEQEKVQARQQYETAVYSQAITKLSAQKDYAYLGDPDVKAVFDVLYERYRGTQKGALVNPLPLAQAFKSIVDKLRGTPARRATQREEEKANLQQRRNKVRGAAPARAPMRPSRGGGKPAKGGGVDVRATMRKYGISDS